MKVGVDGGRRRLGGPEMRLTWLQDSMETIHKHKSINGIYENEMASLSPAVFGVLLQRRAFRLDAVLLGTGESEAEWRVRGACGLIWPTVKRPLEETAFTREKSGQYRGVGED